MKQNLKDGLYMGFSLWIFSMLLSVPLGFLQMGYNPRYLLQLIFAIAMLVRCCKKPVHSNWVALFTLEGMVLINAVVHLIRSNTQPGFTGIAMFFSGIFGLVSILILAVVSLCLYLHHKN